MIGGMGEMLFWLDVSKKLHFTVFNVKIHFKHANIKPKQHLTHSPYHNSVNQFWLRDSPISRNHVQTSVSLDSMVPFSVRTVHFDSQKWKNQHLQVLEIAYLEHF